MEGYVLANYKNGMDIFGCSILSYEEAYEKYSKEIENGVIDQDSIDNILAVFMDLKNGEIEYFKGRIKLIYETILNRKYLSEEGLSDVGSIYDLVKNIVSLKADSSFMEDYEKFLNNGSINFYNIPKLCKEVYEYFVENHAWKEICNIPFEEQEELQPEHLLDIKYHLDHFREWNKGDKHFEEVLNQDFWRLF